MTKEQIEGFLVSDDIEMVKLGAVYLQKFLPKRHWTKILAECSRNEDRDTPITSIWLSPKWDYRIEGKTIIIIGIESTTPHTTLNPGVWSQLSHGYKHTYNTGTFNLGTLTTAIGQFYNKQKPTRNEQTKKKQYRKQSK